MNNSKDKTEENLITSYKYASNFMSVFRHAAFRASVEGHNELSGLLRASAAIRRDQAVGNLQILGKNPSSGKLSNVTRLNIHSIIEECTRLYLEVYPKMAQEARDRNQDDLANWFETLAKAERMEATLYESALKKLFD